MKIGIAGTRGIPNAYGGFEQFAEKFSVLAVQGGHEVAVYCSSTHPYKEPDYKGVELIHCHDPEERLGTFGQFFYDYNCLKDARNGGFDVLLLLGYTSSSMFMHLIPDETISFSNMDGLEWKRSKYSLPVRYFLRLAERWAAIKSDYLIADSPAIQHYLEAKYKRKTRYIAYGAEVFQSPDERSLEKFELTPHQYSLLIARPEPENKVHEICEAYVHSRQEQPLLIIGNFANAYGSKLRKKYESKLIRFPGPLYDFDTLNQLRYHCSLYFHGHSVGGTNPSLLEAMACSAKICAHDNVFNRAVLGDDALYFDGVESLVHCLSSDRHSLTTEAWNASNLEKIRTQYSWDKISGELIAYFMEGLDHG